MRFEGEMIDRSALVDALHMNYGLDVKELTFVPKGEVTHGYVATCQGGQRRFVKVYTKTRLACISAARLETTLLLTREIYEKQVLLAPFPIPSSEGKLSSEVQGFPLVVTNYIDGRQPTPTEFETEEMLARLADATARLHLASKVVETKLGRERFIAPFEEDLVSGLERLAEITDSERWGRRALRDLLLPRREGVLHRLARLHELGRWARRREPEMVICHTDLHYLNVLLDHEDRMHILDWDGAMLAAREHDLVSYTGDRFASFLRRYVAIIGPVRLDPDLFAFYFHRRNLEDLTDWVIRILDENTSEEQDRGDIEGIREDCLSWWDDLEAGPKLREVIAEYGLS